MTVTSALAALPHRLALALGTSLALALPALSQGTMAWQDSTPFFAGPNYASALHAHPSGGAVQVIASDLDPASRVRVRRLDGAGDQLWMTDFVMPVASMVTSGDFEQALVTPRGSTVVAHWGQFTNEVVVTSIDAAGSQEWQTTVSSTIPGLELQPLGLSATPLGDVLVAGIESAHLPTGTEVTGVRALEGTTGALRWTYSRPTMGHRNSDAAAFRNGLSYLLVREAAGLRVDCLDANGNVTYSTPGAEPGFVPGTVFASVTDQGDLVFGTQSIGGGPETNLVRLDAAGSVMWRRAQPSLTFGHASGLTTSDGGIALLEHGINDASRVTRLDEAGQFLWAVVRPATLHRYREITADNQGGLIVTAADFGSFSPEVPAFDFIDASGASNGILTFRSLFVGPAFYGVPSVDPMGNAWVGFLRNTSTEAVAMKLVLGDPSASVVCTPTAMNSTGTSSRLRAAGSGVTAAGNLTLVADQLPANQSVLFLAARSSGLTPNPGGSVGTLCLGGSIGRFLGPGQVRTTDASGLASLPLDLLRVPNGSGLVPVTAGDTWLFQAWHRDFAAGSATSNLTGAIAVTFF